MRRGALLGLLALAGCHEKPHDKLTPVSDTSEAVVEAALNSPGIHPSAPLVPPPPGNGKQFKALGTEPFWSIEVLDGKLLYTSPEQPTAVAIEAHMTAKGKHGDGGLMWEGRMNGKPVTLTIRKGQCSDGMSDTVYPFKSTFTWGERTEQGCAIQK